MPRSSLKRFIYPFFFSIFPENLVPLRKLHRKIQKALFRKKRYLRKTSKAAQNMLIRQYFFPLKLHRNANNLSQNYKASAFRVPYSGAERAQQVIDNPQPKKSNAYCAASRLCCSSLTSAASAFRLKAASTELMTASLTPLGEKQKADDVSVDSTTLGLRLPGKVKPSASSASLTELTPLSERETENIRQQKTSQLETQNKVLLRQIVSSLIQKLFQKSKDVVDITQKNRQATFSGKNALQGLKKQNKRLRFLFDLSQLKLELYKKQAQFLTFFHSNYKKKLLERKKISFLYGNLPKIKLKKVLNLAKKTQTNTAENFLTLLELRLDVILYRISFCQSVSAAHQLIAHKKVLVNGILASRPGLLLNPGDTVRIVPYFVNLVKKDILQSLNSSFYFDTENTYWYSTIGIGKNFFNSLITSRLQAETQALAGDASNNIVTNNAFVKKKLKKFFSFSYQRQAFWWSPAIQTLCKKLPKLKSRFFTRKLRVFLTQPLQKLFIKKAFSAPKVVASKATAKLHLQQNNTNNTILDFDFPYDGRLSQKKTFINYPSFFLQAMALLFSKNALFHQASFGLHQRRLLRRQRMQTVCQQSKKQSSEVMLGSLTPPAKACVNEVDLPLVSSASEAELTDKRDANTNANNTLVLDWKSNKYTTNFQKLRLQRILHKERSPKLIQKGLRVSPMKPLHIEVSYTLLSAVVLYFPQKLAFPASIDLDLIFRELES